jgi:hypothetical protein
LFSIDLPGPEEFAHLAVETPQERAGKNDPFDLIVEIPQSADPDPWCRPAPRGSSPLLSHSLGKAEVREVIDAGP